MRRRHNHGDCNRRIHLFLGAINRPFMQHLQHYYGRTWHNNYVYRNRHLSCRLRQSCNSDRNRKPAAADIGFLAYVDM
jgi:hypothetical protein